MKAIPSPDMPEGAVYTKLLEEAAAELGMKLPVGVIKAIGAQKGTTK